MRILSACVIPSERSDEESHHHKIRILSFWTPKVWRIYALVQTQIPFLRCAGVTFFEESNQIHEGCDSLALQRCTSVECYVCYKSRKFETSFALLTRSTNFFVIFVKIFQPAKALEIFLLSADSAIYIRGKAPNPSNFAKAALPSLRNWGAVRWAAFSRKV